MKGSERPHGSVLRQAPRGGGVLLFLGFLATSSFSAAAHSFQHVRDAAAGS